MFINSSLHFGSDMVICERPLNELRFGFCVCMMCSAVTSYSSQMSDSMSHISAMSSLYFLKNSGCCVIIFFNVGSAEMHRVNNRKGQIAFCALNMYDIIEL